MLIGNRVALINAENDGEKYGEGVVVSIGVNPDPECIGFVFLIMLDDGTLKSATDRGIVLLSGEDYDPPASTSPGRLELRPLTDMTKDEWGGFMQRVRLCPGTEAYLHLFPIQSGVDGQSPDPSLDTGSQYWQDFLTICEGMDGPLQTIEQDGQEFLFFVVPAMT